MIKSKSGQGQLAKITESPETQQANEETNIFDLLLNYMGQYIQECEVLERLHPNVKKVEQKLGQFIHREEETLTSFKKDWILFNDDQSIYKGNWINWNSNFEKHNNGILITEDGSKFEGNWIHDEISGYGRYISHTGSYYEGNWVNEMANGEGTFDDGEGLILTGTWFNDQLHGFGKECLPNGSYYQGEFVNGDKTGKGEFYWADGSYYKGEFLNSKITGFGIMKFSDGRIFEGEWKNNIIEGQGVFKWTNGNYYDGSFKNNLKDGIGKLYTNDKIYFGNWLLDKMNGKGQLTYHENNIVINGIWRMGKLVKKEINTDITKNLQATIGESTLNLENDLSADRTNTGNQNINVVLPEKGLNNINSLRK
jgi:hypothetical protein